MAAADAWKSSQNSCGVQSIIRINQQLYIITNKKNKQHGTEKKRIRLCALYRRQNRPANMCTLVRNRKRNAERKGGNVRRGANIQKNGFNTRI